MSSKANLSSNTFRQEGDKLYQNEGKIMKDKTAKKKGKLKTLKDKIKLNKNKAIVFLILCYF